jgi:hypothetical protein
VEGFLLQLVDCFFVVFSLEEARDNGSIVLSHPTAVKSLLLKFVLILHNLVPISWLDAVKAQFLSRA